MKCTIDNFKNAYYPDGSVTQYFGENYKLYKEAFDMDGHNGIDIVAPWGSPLYCFKAGKVVEVKQEETGYGKYIRVLTPADKDGFAEEWTYGHMSRIDVVLGQQLTKDEQFGLMGNTGFVVSGSTPFWKYNPYAGTHVHVGCRKVKMFQKGDKTWNISWATGDKGTILNYENGFKGSVDFASELGTGEEDIKKVYLNLSSVLNNLVTVLKGFLLVLKNK